MKLRLSSSSRSLRTNLSRILILLTFLSAVTLIIRFQQARVNQLLNAYHPISRSRLVRSRLRHKCQVALPKPEQVDQYPFSEWSLSRFAAYYNIYFFLKAYWNDTTTKPNVLDLGGSTFLEPFNKSIHRTVTRYPEVDIQQTKYLSNTFDAVAADQVLEHTIFPHLAMMEMHRILKPGGLALITTVAYNPLHESTKFHDLWRFMVDGLLILSMPFEGGVVICGSWGSAHAVAVRAAHGMGSPIETRLHFDGRKDELKNNDRTNPFLVWLVVKK